MRLAYFVCIVLSAAAAVGSVNLKRELQDFYDILPKVRMGFIVARHSLFDSDFNTACAYLKSINPKSDEMQKLAKVPEVQDIVNYLGIKDTTFDMSFLQKSARSLEYLNGAAEGLLMDRSFNSFIDDIVYILPNGDIKKLLRQKVTSDSELGALYSKVMDPQFKVLVDRARNADQLSGLFNTMKRNKIDVDFVLRQTFKLLDKWSILN